MPFIALIAVLLGLAGCGTEERGAGAPATTPPPAESEPAPPSDEAGAKPPPIVLESAAGSQVAVAESSCVYGPDTAVCIDTSDQEPAQLSLVRPGEEVVIRLRDASVTRGSVRVRPLPGCDDGAVAQFRLEPGPETRWRVDLEPGQYELQVFARFEAEDGRSGDVSGSLGIFVAEGQPQKIIPVPDSFVGC